MVHIRCDEIHENIFTIETSSDFFLRNSILWAVIWLEQLNAQEGKTGKNQSIITIRETVLTATAAATKWANYMPGQLMLDIKDERFVYAAWRNGKVIIPWNDSFGPQQRWNQEAVA
jgi:hypothetical protein